MPGGMVSALGLARDKETSRHRPDETPLIRATLTLDRSLSGAHWIDCREREATAGDSETTQIRPPRGWLADRASRRATIPTANATDIVPTRFSAASAAVHLGLADTPGLVHPRALPRLVRKRWRRRHWQPPSTHIRSPETRTPHTTCASRSPLSLLL
jgi:hypothetical protein